ncbi:MAG: trypsin-like serine protease [Polyangiaceae bacterium]
MRSLTLLFIPLVVSVGACGTGTPGAASGSDAPSMTGDLGQVSQPIIGGSFDTTRQAVVYLQSMQGACTGTIFKVDTAKKVGWVLTAAHCVTPPPTVIVQANDIEDEANRRTYEVIDAYANPSYDSNALTHDVAIVRFYGAGPKTPVIPLTTSPDGLTAGKGVTSVGYGRTTPSNQPPDGNTKRKNITRTLSNVSTSVLTYSLSGGGICSGDSGGPVLYSSGGVERVVGVHSNVSGDCTIDGHSMRVTNEFSFINTELARPLPTLGTCDACTKIAESGDEVCANKFRACAADKECKAYYDCIVKCGGASTKCQTQCRGTTPGGAALFNAFLECNCVDACRTECGSSCASAPTCGFRFGKACDTCLNGKCCAEEKTAAADRIGYVCLAEGGGDRCVDSDAYLAFSTCQRTNCAEACGVEPITDPGTTEGDAGTTPGASSGSAAKPAETTESSGCSVGNAGAGTSNPSAVLGFVALCGLGLTKLRESRKKRGAV